MAEGPWTNRARSAATYIARPSVETVTLLVGAGASLSSGAPTTETLEQELFLADEDRFGGDISKLSEELHKVPGVQVENTIKPLFEERIHPHLGYLSLAALSRYIRVLIVNLNWDSAVEDACEQVGLAAGQWASVSLGDGVEAVQSHLDNPDCRLVNLHLHGRLGYGEIRFGRRHTLSFDSDEEEFVWSKFFSNPTIVVGASLRGEYDISKLLDEASEKGSEEKAPFWLFSRQAERTHEPEDGDIRKLLGRHKSDSNFAGDPYVDFDRLMIELLETSVGRPLCDVFRGSGLAEPRPDSLVLPSPKLLRGHLHGPGEGRFLAWVGERKVGKSTNARLISHWAALRSEQPGEVGSHSGHVDCAREAKKLVKCGEASVDDFVVFEDPFGTGGEYESNDEFVSALSQVLEGEDRPRVMVTSCASNWRRAKLEYPELGEWAEEILARPTVWYRGLDLAANADDPESVSPAMVTRRVLEGVASTPERVATANETITSNKLGGGTEDEQVIEEKLALVRDLPDDEQEFLALVRFFELSSSVAPQRELINCFQQAKGANPAGDALHMLEHFELDGDSFWRFAHHTDRAAFDRLYAEKGKGLLAEVLEHVYGEEITESVCAVWLAIDSARRGEFGRIEALRVDEKREWGPVMLEEVANSAQARPLLPTLLRRGQPGDEDEFLPPVEEHDFWSLRELVYEVVRLWPELHESERALEIIDEALADEARMGRYCVIESLLYFQDTTHSETWQRDERLMELWDMVTAARWKIVKGKDAEARVAEVALIIDALAWYKPPLPPDQLNRWVKQLVDAGEKEPRLKGAFALTALYHPPGEELFTNLGMRSPLDYVGYLSEEQVAEAAALVRWHYIHQSRARALLPRRRLEPANPDYLRRTEQTRRMRKPQAKQVQEFIEQMATYDAHAGWAVHLGMNLHWTAGNFDSGFLGRHIESVQDEDDGLITAATTYAIPSGALDAIQRYFHRPRNRKVLLARMREGCDVAHAVRHLTATVKPPRFNSGRNPYELHKELKTPWGGALERLNENPSTDPEFVSRVHAILRTAYEEGFLELDAATTFEQRIRAGDYGALEVERTQSPGAMDEEFDRWLKRQDSFTELVVLAALDPNVTP